MSRVGSSVITIPDGVTVTLIDGELTAKGKIGELTIKTHNLINVDINNDQISFKTENKSKFTIFFHTFFKVEKKRSPSNPTRPTTS